MDDDDDDRPSLDDWQPDAPLLSADEGDRHRRDSSSSSSSNDFSRGPPANRKERRRKRKPWQIAHTPRAISAVACTAVFLWVLSGMVAMVPGVQLAEDMLCRRQHDLPRLDPDQRRLCKADDDVQASLAWLFGLVMALDAGVGLVATLPFGVLADRARAPAYRLAAAGQLASVAWTLLVLRLALPVELVLLGPAFALLGGGLTVALVVLYAVMADVNPPADRATAYFYSSLAANLAVFVGPPLAAKAMALWSPWVPMSMSLAATALAGGIMLMVPETAAAAARGRKTSRGAAAKDQRWSDAVGSRLARVFHDSDLRSVLGRRPVALLLAAFALAAPLSSGMGPLFLQYYGRRFGGSAAGDAGYVLAVRGALTVAVVGALLPALSRRLGPSSRRRLPAFRRDLVLARASAALAALGYVLLGGASLASLVAGAAVLALGAGLGPLCRSLISGLVDADQTSQVFTVVGIVEGIASLPSGPFLAWAFSSSMRLGGLWLGLPFFLLGGLGLLVVFVLGLVHTDRGVADFRSRTGDDCVPLSVDMDTQLENVH
ncbi:putative general substrate transporter protein [Rosellinia necatrix]|uniref:Putative general substrate transporter protein n=1 Tax=Rosellinia necatrix TaxID=77044 RepID=A0A1S7UNL9_ROSNE|nr:putative general substrate transporter protein [Rosellinia necatrix]